MASLLSFQNSKKRIECRLSHDQQPQKPPRIKNRSNRKCIRLKMLHFTLHLSLLKFDYIQTQYELMVCSFPRWIMPHYLGETIALQAHPADEKCHLSKKPFAIWKNAKFYFCNIFFCICSGHFFRPMWPMTRIPVGRLIALHFNVTVCAIATVKGMPVRTINFV